MKKKMVTKALGVIMAAVCVFSTMGIVTAFSTSAAETSPPDPQTTDNTQSTNPTEDNTAPTTYLEPGIYPIDGYNYMVVHEDRTFEVVHCDQPSQEPVFTPA